MNRFVLVLLVVATAVGCEKRFVQKSNSMAPTINAGDLLKVRPTEGTSFQRFEVIAFNPPFSPTSTFVMRIIGLPNEMIRYDEAGVYVNGQAIPAEQIPNALRHQTWRVKPGLSTNSNMEWKLRQGELFVVGDNLMGANDSRYWGPLSISNLIGSVTSIRRPNSAKWTPIK